jgi:hypothetical protein
MAESQDVLAIVLKARDELSAAAEFLRAWALVYMDNQ